MAKPAAKAVRQTLIAKTIQALTDGTIGSVERLAGIGPDSNSRYEFWKPFAAIPNDGGFRAAMLECRRRIAENTEVVIL